MEIIHARHPLIYKEAIKKQHLFIFITEDQYVFFSSSACVALELYEGEFIYFVVDGSSIWFYKSVEPSGFRLFIGRNRQSVGGFTLKIINRQLVQFLRSRAKLIPNEHYKIMPTETEYQGNKLIAIQTT